MFVKPLHFLIEIQMLLTLVAPGFLTYSWVSLQEVTQPGFLFKLSDLIFFLRSQKPCDATALNSAHETFWLEA
jgi:hypothetical protein